MYEESSSSTEEEEDTEDVKTGNSRRTKGYSVQGNNKDGNKNKGKGRYSTARNGDSDFSSDYSSSSSCDDDSSLQATDDSSDGCDSGLSGEEEDVNVQARAKNKAKTQPRRRILSMVNGDSSAVRRVVVIREGAMQRNRELHTLNTSIRYFKPEEVSCCSILFSC